MDSRSSDKYGVVRAIVSDVAGAEPLLLLLSLMSTIEPWLGVVERTGES